MARDSRVLLIGEDLRAGVPFGVTKGLMEQFGEDRVLDTNLKGYFLVAQAVAPHMIRRGRGKVIHVSSIFGAVGMNNQLAYACSKGGINQMTKVMAIEWAKQGITVNAIGPTYFETPSWRPCATTRSGSGSSTSGPPWAAGVILRISWSSCFPCLPGFRLCYGSNHQCRRRTFSKSLGASRVQKGPVTSIESIIDSFINL
jgi:hypothetical protein